MKKLIPLLLLLAMLLTLAACGGGDALKGTWVDKGSEEGDVEKTWVFNGRGVARFQVPEWRTDSEGTYSVDGDTVTIMMPAWDEEKVYEFRLEGDSLTLTATDEYSPSYDMVRK